MGDRLLKNRRCSPSSICMKPSLLRPMELVILVPNTGLRPPFIVGIRRRWADPTWSRRKRLEQTSRLTAISIVRRRVSRVSCEETVHLRHRHRSFIYGSQLVHRCGCGMGAWSNYVRSEYGVSYRY